MFQVPPQPGRNNNRPAHAATPATTHRHGSPSMPADWPRVPLIAWAVLNAALWAAIAAIPHTALRFSYFAGAPALIAALVARPRRGARLGVDRASALFCASMVLGGLGCALGLAPVPGAPEAFALLAAFCAGAGALSLYGRRIPAEERIHGLIDTLAIVVGSALLFWKLALPAFDIADPQGALLLLGLVPLATLGVLSALARIQAVAAFPEARAPGFCLIASQGILLAVQTADAAGWFRHPAVFGGLDALRGASYTLLAIGAYGARLADVHAAPALRLVDADEPEVTRRGGARGLCVLAFVAAAIAMHTALHAHGLQERGIYLLAFATVLLVLLRQIALMGEARAHHERLRAGIEEQRRQLQQEEDRYAALFNACPSGLILWTAEGTVEDCNPAAERIFNTPRQQLIGRRIAELLRCDTCDRFCGRGTPCGKPCIQPESVTLNHSPDNRVLSCKWQSMPVRTARGHETRVVSIVDDVTEAHQTRHEYIETAARLQSILDSADEGICGIDERGNIAFVNSAGARLLGRHARQIIGMPARQAFGPAAESMMRDQGKAAADGSAPMSDVFSRPDGKNFPAEYRVAARKEQTGREGTVVVFQDISARRQAEHALVESVEFSRAVLGSLTSHVAVVNHTGIIVQVNDAWKLFRARIGDGSDVGTDYREACRRVGANQSDIDAVLEGLQRVLEGRLSHFAHEYSIDAGEERLWYAVTITPLHTPQGGAVISHFDISERKRSEDELVAARNDAEYARSEMEGLNAQFEDAMLRANELASAAEAANMSKTMLLQSIPMILINVEEDGCITQWSGMAEKDLGVKGSVAMRTTFRECPINWDWERVIEYVDLACESGATTQLDDVKFTRPSGEEGFLNITIHPMTPDGMGGAGFLLLGVDVTERRMLEMQLAHSQKMESIGQLAAGIAHEINTPTQYIGDNNRFLLDAVRDVNRLLEAQAGLLEIVKTHEEADDAVARVEAVAREIDVDYLSEEMPKALEQSLEGIARVSKIVQAMKEFSHPGSSEKASVDICRAIENTVTVARNEWKYVADVVTDFDAAMPLVPCYPDDLNQVFLNVIVNASHAITDVVQASGGEERGRITIKALMDGDWAEVRFSDTGGGIPEAIRGRIFDPFFTTKEVGKGTGQGLAIAHAIVVGKHKGTITFETEEGVGTTFIIRLPLD